MDTTFDKRFINSLALVDPFAEDIDFEHKLGDAELIRVFADAAPECRLLLGPLQLHLYGLRVAAEGTVKHSLHLWGWSLHNLCLTLSLAHVYLLIIIY